MFDTIKNMISWDGVIDDCYYDAVDDDEEYEDVYYPMTPIGAAAAKIVEFSHENRPLTVQDVINGTVWAATGIQVASTQLICEIRRAHDVRRMLADTI